jgi:hypothetical protein
MTATVAVEIFFWVLVLMPAMWGLAALLLEVRAHRHHSNQKRQPALLETGDRHVEASDAASRASDTG